MNFEIQVGLRIITVVINIYKNFQIELCTHVIYIGICGCKMETKYIKMKNLLFEMIHSFVENICYYNFFNFIFFNFEE